MQKRNGCSREVSAGALIDHPEAAKCKQILQGQAQVSFTRVKSLQGACSLD